MNDFMKGSSNVESTSSFQLSEGSENSAEIVQKRRHEGSVGRKKEIQTKIGDPNQSQQKLIETVL